MTADASIARRPAGLVELPLSALQERIWFLCTAYTGTASPILFLVWRIHGPLRTDAWLRAVSAVVNRHESLRTAFPLRDGGPVQVVGPPDGLDTDVVDLRGVPGAEREERAAELVLARTHALLDLVRGPLVRSCLIRLADEHHVWCFTMHHLLADGASLRILTREVRTLYQSFVDGAGPALPELPVQYGDFALWQQTAQRVAEERDLRYWRERLAGVPVLDLPTDRPRPPEKGVHSVEVFHPMSGDLARRVTRFASTQRCTPFMVLLAAVQTLLSAYSGQDDICVGSPVAGRTAVELEPLVGLFSNTVALRGDLSGDPTFRELLLRTRAAVIEALRRQNVPFGRVVAALDLPRVPNRTQVFQVIFNMRTDNDHKDPSLAGLWIEDFPHGHPKTLHDLVIDIWRLDADVLRTGFRYDSTLFTAGTVAAMAKRYEHLLSTIVDEPDIHLSELIARG
jgi:hypothetical protein